MNGYERRLAARKAKRKESYVKHSFGRILMRLSLEKLYEETFIQYLGIKPSRVQSLSDRELKEATVWMQATMHERDLGGQDGDDS